LSKLLGIKFELRGHENIVQDSGCVVLMNHQSALDILGESCGLRGTGLPLSHSHAVSEILNNQFDVHVTVHRDTCLTVKPTICTNYSNLFLE